jgi:hypothetical protein
MTTTTYARGRNVTDDMEFAGTGPIVTTYGQLERLALPRLESFQTDLQTHDREWIRKNPGVPFIHMTGRSGTVMVPLFKADSDAWPAEGERIPYCFGQCDRWHILKDSTGIVDCQPEEHTYHHCNGRSVRPITHTEAQQIVREYRRIVSAAWGR